MCEELNRELKRGEEAMKAVAKHLIAMGAHNLEQVVSEGSTLVKVTAIVVSDLRDPELRSQE